MYLNEVNKVYCNLGSFLSILMCFGILNFPSDINSFKAFRVQSFTLIQYFPYDFLIFIFCVFIKIFCSLGQQVVHLFLNVFKYFPHFNQISPGKNFQSGETKTIVSHKASLESFLLGFSKMKTSYLYFSFYILIPVHTPSHPPIPSTFPPTSSHMHFSERVKYITLGKVQGCPYYI